MMKALLINGSPRGQKSNSKIMSDFFEQGLISLGVETESIFLVEKNLELCRGCFSCWKKSSENCIINDEMNSLIEKYITADYVVFSTPVYFFTMPALLKNFIDRLLPLAKPQMYKDANGNYSHEPKYKKYPKVVLLSNCGFPGNGNFEGIKTAFSFLYPTAIICRNQGELLKIKQNPVKQIIENYGANLKKAAIQLVQTGSISKELEITLNESLIPDQDYVEGANQSW